MDTAPLLDMMFPTPKPTLDVVVPSIDDKILGRAYMSSVRLENAACDTEEYIGSMLLESVYFDKVLCIVEDVCLRLSVVLKLLTLELL